jgi:hypothetical protein
VDLKYYDIPPSRVVISNLGPVTGGGGGPSSITLHRQNSDTTSCLATQNIGSQSTIIVPLVCPDTGLLVLTARREIRYTARRDELQSIGFSNGHLFVSNISTVLYETNVLASFHVSSDNYVSFIISVTDPGMVIKLQIYDSSNCAVKTTITCPRTANYPCYYITTSVYAAADYYLVITDDAASTPSSANYNLTIDYVLGNTACRNISNELTNCSRYISSDDDYQITPGNVAGIETSAWANYLILLNGWPRSCNDSLLSFACQAAFRPHLCTASGTLTTSYLCDTECMDTLNSKCGQGNPCGSASCLEVSNTFVGCTNRPPPGSGPSGGNGQLAFNASLLQTVFLSLVVLKCVH